MPRVANSSVARPSGDQRGRPSAGPFRLVTCTRLPPLASLIQISSAPVSSETQRDLPAVGRPGGIGFAARRSEGWGARAGCLRPAGTPARWRTSKASRCTPAGGRKAQWPDRWPPSIPPPVRAGCRRMPACDKKFPRAANPVGSVDHVPAVRGPGDAADGARLERKLPQAAAV